MSRQMELQGCLHLDLAAQEQYLSNTELKVLKEA